MSNKNLYREFCRTEKQIPIFQQAWWLDATCGDNWDVAIVKRDGGIVGALPYLIRNTKWIFRILHTPPLTQFLGPWIKYPEGMKMERKLTFDKEIFYELIDSLPECDAYSQNFSYQITNWLPFFWRGYSASPRYTYVIDNLSDLEALYNKDFSKKLRSSINKASKNVMVRDCDDLESLYKMVSMTFERQRKKTPYSYNYLQQVDKAVLINAGRKIFLAYDSDGRVHAGVYIIWDGNSAYYLIGGEDPTLRNSQAMSLLLWEAIKFSATVTKRFDFEGSVIEPIEGFFKRFGANQKIYFQVTKNDGKLYYCLLTLWHALAEKFPIG